MAAARTAKWMLLPPARGESLLWKEMPAPPPFPPHPALHPRRSVTRTLTTVFPCWKTSHSCNGLLARLCPAPFLIHFPGSCVRDAPSLSLETRTLKSTPLYVTETRVLLPQIKLVFHLVSGSRIFLSISQSTFESTGI